MKRDHYQEYRWSVIYVVYCERIVLHVIYYTNVIVDTIVNVISEVWIELSAQTAWNCVTSFSKIVFIVIGFSCMGLFKI